MRKRGSILAVAMITVLLVVACGRATEQEINDALGIQPTATLSQEDLATASALAVAEASAVAAGSTPVPESGVASLGPGNVTMGRLQWQIQCSVCHMAADSPQGPAILVPDSPMLEMTDQQIFDLVRTGEGHGGTQPFLSSRVSDRQLIDAIAYIREQLAQQ